MIEALQTGALSYLGVAAVLLILTLTKHTR